VGDKMFNLAQGGAIILNIGIESDKYTDEDNAIKSDLKIKALFL